MTTTDNALLLTTVDLTRSCTANENYFAWLSIHAELTDSIAIASYLGAAAELFEHAAQSQREAFDALAARDQLGDILMASAPLSAFELQVAVAQCIRDSCFEEAA